MGIIRLQSQRALTRRLSDARGSTLLDLVTSLHCLSSYCICHNYIIIGACACVSVGVSEEASCAHFELHHSVFLNYHLVDKLLLELVVVKQHRAEQ